MTSFSEPNGIKQTVTTFHIKADFFLWIIVVRLSYLQMISRKRRKGWTLNFGDVYFGEPYLALHFQSGTNFSDPRSFSKHVAIWSWLLLLKIETHTLNMKTYWKQWLHIVIKKKLDNIEIMKTLPIYGGGVAKLAKTCMQITCIQIFFFFSILYQT